MADSTTTNYNLIKVEIGGSTDTWGGKLNANADAIDAALVALPKLDGTRPYTGIQSFPYGIQIEDFTFTVTGGVLQIKHSGTLIAKLDDAGTLTAIDVVADDTL